VWIEALQTFDYLEITFALSYVDIANGSIAGQETKTDTLTSEHKCTGHPRKRYYVHGHQETSGIVGAQANITTRTMRLCDEDTVPAKHSAKSVAHIAVVRIVPPHNMWAQLGFKRFRFSGAEAITYTQYYEVASDPTGNDNTKYENSMDPGVPPTGTHNYRCELHRVNGSWHFYFDAAEHVSAPGTWGPWINKSAQKADWTGEIRNQEDQMPGTVDEKCMFTDCKYTLVTTTVVDANFNVFNFATDDANQWQFELTGADSFSIWDTTPNQ
jgi:hypothetical protein